MVFEHYLLLLLTILPLINRFSFWFFTIQLKEYRRDRFKEYLLTPQGKKALFNIWSVIELPLFLLSIIIFVDPPFEYIIYNVLFTFFLIQNIFVARKILTGKIIKPSLTGRLLLTLGILVFGLTIDLFFIIFYGFENFLYTYVLSLFLFTPLYIFLVILISLPLVNYFKNKKINKAIRKSSRNKKTIKIGITGSYGKSSVKEYLASILEQDGTTLKTPENINTELGVSSIVMNKLNNTYKYFIAEMGAYKIGEINILGKIVDHKYGFLTAIGNQHLGLFGSQSNIKTGKAEIANSILKNKGILYVNWDDNFIREIEFNKKLNIIKYGNYKGSDAIYSILNTREAVTTFTIEYKKNIATFETKLLGKHNIVNLTGVISLCYDLGLDASQIKKYLENIKVPKNTLNVINSENFILIDDTYNLSEDGLYAGLDAMNSFNDNKVLVMDDILELGRDAKNIHYVVGKFIAKRNDISKVLFCGVNYKKDFIKGLVDGGFLKKNIVRTLDKVEKNSIILFEGRGSGKYLDKLKQNV
ncbi:MAG: UDP-N-acetylmuramoyl-tripeptide--D-alanyl-D-alanine ligase [Candidatus Gracilibacteria bacterium]